MDVKYIVIAGNGLNTRQLKKQMLLFKVGDAMKNKKGFTLVEIIVCIALLAVIGSVIGVSIFNNSNENKEEEKIINEVITAADVYYLETELKKAITKHSELLAACTDLQIKADEIIAGAKFSRLKRNFNFKDALRMMMELAQNKDGKPVSIKEVAGRQNISEKYFVSVAERQTGF